MKKEKYDRSELEIITFLCGDVITTSSIDYEDDELPFVPHKP